MTTYFDQINSNINRIKDSINIDYDDYYALIKLEEIDEEICDDVTLCSEMSGCPEDIRRAIDNAIVNYSSSGQPPNSRGLEFKDAAEYASILLTLISRLHDIFHSLAIRNLDNFGDDPRQPVWELIANAEERREKLVPEERQLKKFKE